MHSPRRQRRGDAALHRGSNGGTQRLTGTAHAAPADHVLAAPPQTRRRRSAPWLQRRCATTTRHCSLGAGRSCTRRAATDAATPLCAAAPTAVRYDHPSLLNRRRQVMHSPRRHRRGDAALRRGSNGGALRLTGTAHATPADHEACTGTAHAAPADREACTGTAHAAPEGYALAAPPQTRRRRSAPRLQRLDAATTLTAHAAPVIHALAAPPKTRRRRLQRRDSTTTRHCLCVASRPCTRRAA
jgi:hypothetical protein